MTLSVATIEPAAVLQTAAVGSVAPTGPVHVPVTVPTSGPPPGPQDGVDRVPHADLVLKDVLIHADPRLAAALPPLQTAQAQLALAQHRQLGTPFAGLMPGLVAPGGEALSRPASDAPAGPLSKAAEAPGAAPLAGPAGAGLPPVAPAAGPPPPQPAQAASPAQAAQAPAQSPVAAHAPASPAVNPNPPPPPNAVIARQLRRRERWRPRDPRGKDDQQGRDPGGGRQG
jgi:hypothetical protein